MDPELLAGIAAYRRHPWQRRLDDPPMIWEEGDSRLLDYGSPADPAVLFVPSLINRAYVLDLAPGHSLMRWLAGQGFRPLLLDWGWPGEVERGFGLDDYIAGRLERAIDAVGTPMLLAGYCMGGLMTLAVAQRHPDRVRGLVLLATPWDFQVADPAGARKVAETFRQLEPSLPLTGTLPIDAIQMLFSLLDRGGIETKFRDFARQKQDSDRARLFVAVEDWLSDGVPLPAPVARECLTGWYGENRPARGEWRIKGEAVLPASLRLPCFVAVPGRDRIVPPEGARPLAGLIAGCVLHQPPTGHVGMVIGDQAALTLWQPLRDWFQSQGRPI